MNNKLSKLSQLCLESFIDAGKFLINNPISYTNVRKFLYGGAPDGYYSTFYNLRRNGYIKFKSQHEEELCYLTKKGEKTVIELLVKLKIKKQKWDGKWRIIIFDIPENRHKFRDNIRKSLLNLGFVKLQKSVWITPYDIIDDLYNIIPGFREGDWFEYAEAKYISSENKLKEYFGLK
jgi:DNA-binding transcriptional regulator PaaX